MDHAQARDEMTLPLKDVPKSATLALLEFGAAAMLHRRTRNPRVKEVPE